MANKVEFGLAKCYYALMTNETTPTYAAPVAIPGAVNLSLDPQGELSTFYADNIAYYVAAANNGYTGELEMALLTDTVLAAILGWEVDDNGLLVEIADAQPVPFALLFEVEGNEAEKRYCFYNCKVNRPATAHATKTETVEPMTSALPLVITPITIDSNLVVKSHLEYSIAAATVFNAWYTAVTLPEISVS